MMKVDGVSSRIVREYKYMGFLQAHGLLIWLNCILRESEHLPPRHIPGGLGGKYDCR